MSTVSSVSYSESIICFQELKAKLAEEISRMRYFITGQRSDAATLANTERSAADVEVLMEFRLFLTAKLDPWWFDSH